MLVFSGVPETIQLSESDLVKKKLANTYTYTNTDKGQGTSFTQRIT
jgi:hypothetical protein